MSAETNESAQPTPEKKSNTTLLILLTILGLGVAGLIYDRKVARPALETAYDDVAALVEKTNRLVTESVNPEDVQATVGRPPVQSFEDGDDYVEVFAWRSGLPIRTHKLYAVYREQHGQKVLYRHAKYKYENRSDVIAIPEAIIIEGEPDDESAADSEPEAGAESSAGDGERQGRGRPAMESSEQDADTNADSDAKSDAPAKAAEKPEATKPEAKKPEAETPEAKKPEAKKPEAKNPEAKKPEAKKPEAKKPEAKTAETPGGDES